MAYFDSPKNRALWQIELKKLQEEKASRGQRKEPAAEQRMQKTTPSLMRVKTSYRELVHEEAAVSMRGAKTVRTPQMQQGRERTMQPMGR